MKRCIGISVSGEKVTLVEGVVDGEAPVEILTDQTWKLQEGDRASAYQVIHYQIRDYLTERRVEYAVVKASALSRSGIKMAHWGRPSCEA